MELDLAALPDDVDALHQLIRQLAAERTGERKALSAAQVEIERLRLIVQKLQRLQFGRRAERLDGNQLELGLEDLGADIGRAENYCRRGRPTRNRSPGIDPIGRACLSTWNARM
jgi:transposase